MDGLLLLESTPVPWVRWAVSEWLGVQWKGRLSGRGGPPASSPFRSGQLGGASVLLPTRDTTSRCGNRKGWAVPQSSQSQPSLPAPVIRLANQPTSAPAAAIDDCYRRTFPTQGGEAVYIDVVSPRSSNHKPEWGSSHPIQILPSSPCLVIHNYSISRHIHASLICSVCSSESSAAPVMPRH